MNSRTEGSSLDMKCPQLRSASRRSAALVLIKCDLLYDLTPISVHNGMQWALYIYHDPASFAKRPLIIFIKLSPFLEYTIQLFFISVVLTQMYVFNNGAIESNSISPPRFSIFIFDMLMYFLCFDICIHFILYQLQTYLVVFFHYTYYY